MRQMLLAKRTVFLEFEALRLLFLVLHARIVDALTFCALEMDDLSHRSYLML